MKPRFVVIILFSTLLLLLGSCGGGFNEKEAEEREQEQSIDIAIECPFDYNPICGNDGLTYQNSCFSSLRDIGVEYIGACTYTVCSFNGLNHHVMNNMLYYEDNLTRPYIDVLYGTFTLQADGDGWTYVRAINKDSSYYTNRMLEYDTGVTEFGNEIVCMTTSDIPEQLKEFLKTHGKILELKIESYKEQEANTTEIWS